MITFELVKEKAMGKSESFVSNKETHLLKASQRFMSEAYRRKIHKIILENKIKLEQIYGKEKQDGK